MDGPITRGWIDAAIVLSSDSGAVVTCPVCRKGLLLSEDIALPSGEVVERRFYCNVCGSQNFMRLGPKVDQ